MHARRAVAVVALLVSCRSARDADEPVGAPTDQKLTWPVADEAVLIARAKLATPQLIGIAPDGTVVLRGVTGAIEQIDTTGKRSEVAVPAALRGGVVEMSSDGSRLLVTRGDHSVALDRSPGQAVHELGALRDPHLSPDGTKVAFVRDADLWMISIGAAQPIRLTQHPADRDYGVLDPAARELARDRGFWWSPDGRSIAFQRTDAHAVESLYIADPRHPERAPIVSKDPRPGKPIATVDLGIVSTAGGAPRWVTWDVARYPYLANVQWVDKAPLTLTVLDRAQTEVAIVAVDPGTAATRSLLVDKDPAWIDARPDALTWLPDGSGFLWMTESHGSLALDYHAADGSQPRPLVTPDVGLRHVVGVSTDGHNVVIEAARDPREQQVWIVPVAGGAPQPITSDGGIHHARVGRDVIAIMSDHRTGGPSATIVRAAGSRLDVPLPGERPAVAPTTKLEVVTVEDHTQYAAITRPHAFDAKVRYPVLVVADTTPSSKVVVDVMDAYALDQWYADGGFIVVRTDGRGTPDRGRDWQRAVVSDVITIPMNDQIGGLKQLGAKYPELDLSRVGIVGGYFAVMAVLLHPEIYAAAAASSPITDWELVDATFAERYMKTPATNPEGYRRVSALTYAGQLARPLLVLDDPAGPHGLAANTTALLQALYAGAKQAHVAMMPEHASASPDPALALARDKLQLEFFREHLGPPVRPAVMPAPRTEEDEEREERERRQSH